MVVVNLSSLSSIYRVTDDVRPFFFAFLKASVERPTTQLHHRAQDAPKTDQQMAQADAPKADLSKAMKDVEIDEPADWFIHRPCAQLLVRGLLTLPRGLVPTPNFITLMSLLVGWTAAAFMWDGMSSGTLSLGGDASVSVFGLGAGTSLRCAGVLMFLSLVFDCMDGQLARATGQTSPIGRFLDGIADMLVIFSYSSVVIVCGARTHGALWWLIGTISCISLQQHVLFYDKVKIAFDLRFQAKSANDVKKRIADYGLDKSVILAQKAAATDVFSKACLSFAVFYQASLNMDGVCKDAATRQETGKGLPTARNREDAKIAMRLVSFLGTGTHLFMWYLSTFTGATHQMVPYYWLVLNVVAGNAFHLLAWQKSTAAGLVEDPPFEPSSALPFVIWGCVLYMWVC